ncbi:hypothetical protein D1816_15715 [Aquimarina sp. AD10]|uniref:hypothetical protein n=1 Tax=Aquimarina sp. AD10 TaxID=1714849 RepID=UPI000E4CAC37|nr:hypothetical protein [Aquimarina sp. AD10]AXT61738.1 hypothetical protein D1816_15715 [Aquimarina sp. AD10]RKN00911.1 hypothetical protein D7033_06050 [Aquimarina sp. AD10]
MYRVLLLLVVVLIFSCSKDDPEEIEIIEENPNEEIINCEKEDFLSGSFNKVFTNTLISDHCDNIKRENPIQILQYDQGNNRIKTNYKGLDQLRKKGSENQSWFMVQGSEASTIVEILDIDITNGWISLGTTYLGKPNYTIGASIELFNPFVNYSIINNRPLFDPYPTSVSEGNFNYIQPGGIIEKSDGSYVLLTPVVFGAHDKRSIYYATSTNLEDWTFENKKLLGTETIPFAKTSGNVFSTDNPLKLDDGTFLVLLGVQQPNGNYTSAYMIIDEDLTIIKQPTKIMISGWNGPEQNSFPLAITKHNDSYRILLHRRFPNLIDREVHELIVTDLFDALNNGGSIVSSTMIQKGSISSGYLRGKADDATYIKFNNELYILLAGEERSSSYLTSNNRQYGLMSLEKGIWKNDRRSPILVNPVNLYTKYATYNWAWDHLGAFISPIRKNDDLYIFMAFGTDNPDYFISGIKIPL